MKGDADKVLNLYFWDLLLKDEKDHLYIIAGGYGIRIPFLFYGF